jgi:hypothetical protein
LRLTNGNSKVLFIYRGEPVGLPVKRDLKVNLCGKCKYDFLSKKRPESSGLLNLQCYNITVEDSYPMPLPVLNR